MSMNGITFFYGYIHVVLFLAMSQYLIGNQSCRMYMINMLQVSKQITQCKGSVLVCNKCLFIVMPIVYIPYPLEYSPTLEYNLTPFQKSCFWAFSWIEPHFLVKKSPFWGIFWIEPHPKTHIEKYNPVVILERIRYFLSILI